MTYLNLRELEKQLDKARIAVILNLNALDDDLAYTYGKVTEEVKKVVDMAIEVINNKE